MSHDEQLTAALERRGERRADRRAFFAAAVGAAAVGAAFVYADPAAAQSAATDIDVLNFALNLEYLEASYYLWAVNGAGLPAELTTGGASNTAGGTVTGGARVDFSGEPLIGQYAREIAADELAHVRWLRDNIGTSRVALPNINIAGDATGAFTLAARAAGVVGSTATFNPYASPLAFLLGAFIFEDVGVTAYKSAAPLLSTAAFREAASGILAVEAYHAAMVRTQLFQRGIETPAVLTQVQQISDARDRLDGNPAFDPVRGIGPDADQGISPVTGAGGELSNISPANDSGIAYSRSPDRVLNIVYLTQAQVTAGGFFPNGLNGNIRTSTTTT